MTPAELESIRPLLTRALEEDLGAGDITSEAVVDPEARASAEYVAKEDVVACGLELAGAVAAEIDRALAFDVLSAEGQPVPAGAVMARVEGRARSILAAERTSLNFLQRMTGIATATSRYAALLKGTSTRVLDTRKTVPAYRFLDKYAVRCGGGTNHRTGLFDAVLIKNNHLVFHSGPRAAVAHARERVGMDVKIEVEVQSLEELREAIAGGADSVLIDNFSPEAAREAVEIAAGRVPLEASGGITLQSVRAYADAGVDCVSVGALTHSVRAADIHLRMRPLDS